jgi:hypothetical protein
MDVEELRIEGIERQKSVLPSLNLSLGGSHFAYRTLELQ